MRCSIAARMQFRPPPAFGCGAALAVSTVSGSVISTLRAGCHLYLAPTTLSRPQMAATAGAIPPSRRSARVANRDSLVLVKRPTFTA
jgi:hypothetical protein